jgi:large subunit ribosomal protein L25
VKALSISARPREQRGRHLGSLRRNGMIPAVVYGHNQPSLAFETDARSLERLWHHAGKTTLLDLEIEGGSTRKVIIREIQFSPRTGALAHVDFFAPNLRQKTVADVPVVLVGEAPAVEQKLGLLLQVSTTLKVECLPGDLPSQLHADVSGLDVLDSHLVAAEVELPAKVTLLSDPGEVVAKIAGRRGKGMDLPEEEAAAAAAAEGEAMAAASAPETEEG